MNPKTTIVPWLDICGRQWGLEGIDEYRQTDPSGRPEHIHAGYRLKRAKPAQSESGLKRDRARGTYDITARAVREYIVDVVIDLFNSQNGLAELAGACVAADIDQSIRDLLKARGVSFRECVDVEDLTTYTAERVYYQHRLTCRFSTYYGYSLNKTNERIIAVDHEDAINLV